jgi:hypothetical protein
MEWCDPVPLERFIAESAVVSDAAASATPEELDAKFWRGIAARPSPLYGADATEAGSLFDPELKEWNLSALPGGVENDLTQSLPMAIPGLNRSMLYFGRWRSFFAMHSDATPRRATRALAHRAHTPLPLPHQTRPVLGSIRYPHTAEDCELQGASYLHCTAAPAPTSPHRNAHRLAPFRSSPPRAPLITSALPTPLVPPSPLARLSRRPSC